MVSLAHSSHAARANSRHSTARDFDPDEIRRIVRIGRERGLIRGGDTATPIEKDGDPAAGLGAVRSQWMNVDPDLARRWLENNFRNRPLKDDVVAAYARDMINGVWVPTHQGVAFNDADELIDGQHRLRAIILSGRTIRMMVTFGLPGRIAGSEMTTMDAVDRGRTRSVADQLKIQHGMKDGSIIAGIARAIASICSSERTRRLSVGQTLEIFRAWEHPIHWVIAHRSREHGLRCMGVLAGFVFALGAEAGEDADAVGRGATARMFERLVSGEGLEKGMPLTRLRAFLVSEEAQLLTRGTDRGLAELVLWVIWREAEGKPVPKLEMSTAGADWFRAQQAERVRKIAHIFEIPAPK